MNHPSFGSVEKGGLSAQSSEHQWRKKRLTPHQLLIHDVRLEKRAPHRDYQLELRERNAPDLVPASASTTQSSRLIRAAEAGRNPIESQKLTDLEEEWEWLSELRIQLHQHHAYDPDDAAICRWIHVPSKFTEYMPGLLWGLTEVHQSRHAATAIRSLNKCVKKHERYSKHGAYFAPFCQDLLDNEVGEESDHPCLISTPFLDWSVMGRPPPLRFQVDKRLPRASPRLAKNRPVDPTHHPLRSLLQHFYRLEDTNDREAQQVSNQHRPWNF